MILVWCQWPKAFDVTIRPTNVNKLIGWIAWKVESQSVVVGGCIAAVCRHVVYINGVCFTPSTRADGTAMGIAVE